MTQKTCVSGPSPKENGPKLVEILLAQGFVATELAIAFDSFRIANRLAGRELFRLQIVSVDAANTLTSLGGMEITVTPMDSTTNLPDLLIVTAGSCRAFSACETRAGWPWSCQMPHKRFLPQVQQKPPPCTGKGARCWRRQE